MPRANTFLTCAYESCKRRTDDKRAFGHVNTLTDHQQLVYSACLKSQHDRVVCNCHYTSLRRQLAKEQQTQSAARMALLLAAVPAPAVVDAAVLVSPIQPARSLSLPVALALPALPPPAPLARATSMPLLSANTRLCDARQRRRIAFTCVMTGVTWTTLNRLEANLNSHSLNKSTWYSLTQHVWETIEAGKDAGKEAGKGEKGTGKDEQGSETGTADKENSDPSLPSVPRKRQRRVERTPVERKGRSAEQTPTMAVVVMDMTAAGRQSAASAPVSCVQPDSVAARAIMFR